jgi:vacuolar-type H+-ATPase subunit E/Vma4
MDIERREENILIEGIIKSSKEEAQKILADADKGIKSAKENSRSQADTIIRNAEKKATEQASAIRETTARSIKSESRRLLLNARRELLDSIILKIHKNLEAEIGKPSYRRVLQGWITEAALGLGATEAEINASHIEIELIDAGLIKNVQDDIKKLTGREVRLYKSKAEPLSAQGVVLTSKDGRTAYNNQVPTRIMRYESEIRNLAYRELFSEEVL